MYTDPNTKDSTMTTMTMATDNTATELSTLSGMDETPAEETVTVVYQEEGESLYEKFSGQTTPQKAYVILHCETGNLYAYVDGNIGNGCSMALWHGRDIRWSIPPLTWKAANELLDKVKPLAQELLNGFTVSVDNQCNRVGTLTEEADDVSHRIGTLCEEFGEDSDNVEQVWDAAEWFGGVGGYDVQCQELDIFHGMTDEQFDAAVEREEENATRDNVTVDGLRNHLGNLRQHAEENADEDE